MLLISLFLSRVTHCKLDVAKHQCGFALFFDLGGRTAQPTPTLSVAPVLEVRRGSMCLNSQQFRPRLQATHLTTAHLPIEGPQRFHASIGKCAVVCRAPWSVARQEYGVFRTPLALRWSDHFVHHRLPCQSFFGSRCQPRRSIAAVMRRWSAVPMRCASMNSASFATWPTVTLVAPPR